MKMMNDFILAHAAKSIWEDEKNKAMKAIMNLKEKDQCETEAELVEVAFLLGAAAAMRTSASAEEEILSDEEE